MCVRPGVCRSPSTGFGRSVFCTTRFLNCSVSLPVARWPPCSPAVDGSGKHALLLHRPEVTLHTQILRPSGRLISSPHHIHFTATSCNAGLNLLYLLAPHAFPHTRYHRRRSAGTGAPQSSQNRALIPLTAAGYVVCDRLPASPDETKTFDFICHTHFPSAIRAATDAESLP